MNRKTRRAKKYLVETMGKETIRRPKGWGKGTEGSGTEGDATTKDGINGGGLKRMGLLEMG